MSNPYIGPGPFADTEEHRARFFGREVEGNDLCQQLRSDRILVLHAPSGAGKTSLLQAGLIPKLRAEMHQRGRGINIINPIRVGLPPTAEDGCNRWIHSILRSIEEYVLRSEGRQLTPQLEEQLSGMDINHYCQHRRGVRLPGQPTLLIIDQFEEIFTRDRHAHTERVELFTELAKVLGDPGVWAIIALREEYVAALDAYKRLLPTQLASRFHLDFLTAREARQSIREPADKVAGVGFADDAVETLIDDLTYDDDGESALVDPLHLQLVCWDLWEKLEPERGTEIGEQAVGNAFSDRAGRPQGGQKLSPVERALFSYYQKEVSDAASPPELTLGKLDRRGRERRLRDFIERHLIEDERYRRQALIPEERKALAEGAERLVNAHVLRAAVRPYQTWYEISHDRLVEPIRLANRLWFEDMLSEVEKQARRWCQEHRRADFPPLAARLLDQFESGHSNGLLATGSPEEQGCEAAFVAHCRQKLDARRKQKWTMKARGLAVMAVIAVLGVLWQVGQERTRLQIKSDRSELRLQAEQLASEAMNLRWRQGDHERALLLSILARQQIDAASTAEMIERVGNSQSLPEDKVESALWTALQARPFSQTLPNEALEGGAPKRIEGDGQVARVWVKQDGQSRVLQIKVPRPSAEFPTRFGLSWLPECAQGSLLTRRGTRALYLHGRQVALIDGPHCAAPTARVELPAAPLSAVQPAWSEDERVVAVALEPQGADVAGQVALIDDTGAPNKPMLHLVDTVIPTAEALRKGRNPRHATPTALAFLGREGDSRRLVIGYSTGQLMLVSLNGESDQPLDLTAPPMWPPKWDDPEKPRQWPLNGAIVYLAAVDLDGTLVTALHQLALDLPAADYELVEAEHDSSQWLLAVFHGGLASGGGKVFLYAPERLATAAGAAAMPPVELIPNAVGRLGRKLEPLGYISAAYSRDSRKLLIGSDESVLLYFDLNELEPTRLRAPDPTLSVEDYYQPLRGLGAAQDARLALAGAYQSVTYLDGNGTGVYIDPAGRQLIALVEHRGLRLWTLGGANTLQRFAPRPDSAECSERGDRSQLAECRSSPYVYDLGFDGAILYAASNDGVVAAYAPVPDTDVHGVRRLREVWKTRRLPPKLPDEPGGKPKAPSIRTVDHQQSLLAAGASQGEVWVAATTPAGVEDWQLLDAKPQLHRDGLWSVRFRPRAEDQPPNIYQLASAEFHMDIGPARVFLREIDSPAQGPLAQRVLGCFQFPDTSIGETRIAFSADGCRLALSAGAHLRVFDLKGEHCPQLLGTTPEPCSGDAQSFPPFPGQLSGDYQMDYPIYALAMSHYGRYVAVGTTSGELIWMDLLPDICNWESASEKLGSHETLARSKRLDGSRGTLLDVVFLPSSKQASKVADDAPCNRGVPRLVSVGKDGRVRIWNPEDRVANPIEIAGSGNELYSIAVSGDGGLLAAGDSDGQVLVWDRNVHDYACNLVIRNLTDAEWGEHLYQGERDKLKVGGVNLAKLCGETPAEGLRNTPPGEP